MVRSDEELMAAYAKGDLAAFSILYERNKGRILGYLVNKLKDLDRAEEVFQITFAKLHAARKRYSNDIPFLPWIFTLTRNAMIDHLRRDRAYRRLLERSWEQDRLGVDLAPEPEFSDTVHRALFSGLLMRRRTVALVGSSSYLYFAAYSLVAYLLLLTMGRETFFAVSLLWLPGALLGHFMGYEAGTRLGRFIAPLKIA